MKVIYNSDNLSRHSYDILMQLTAGSALPTIHHLPIAKCSNNRPLGIVPQHLTSFHLIYHQSSRSLRYSSSLPSLQPPSKLPDSRSDLPSGDSTFSTAFSSPLFISPTSRDRLSSKQPQQPLPTAYTIPASFTFSDNISQCTTSVQLSSPSAVTHVPISDLQSSLTLQKEKIALNAFLRHLKPPSTLPSYPPSHTDQPSLFSSSTSPLPSLRLNNSGSQTPASNIPSLQPPILPISQKSDGSWGTPHLLLGTTSPQPEVAPGRSSPSTHTSTGESSAAAICSDSVIPLSLASRPHSPPLQPEPAPQHHNPHLPPLPPSIIYPRPALTSYKSLAHKVATGWGDGIATFLELHYKFVADKAAVERSTLQQGLRAMGAAVTELEEQKNLISIDVIMVSSILDRVKMTHSPLSLQDTELDIVVKQLADAKIPARKLRPSERAAEVLACWERRFPGRFSARTDSRMEVDG